MNVLEIRGLTVQLGTGRKAVTAVDDVDLDVPPGGVLGLVGESGSGKSTVARAVVGLVPHAGGQILLNGRDIGGAGRPGRAARRRIQMIFQDPYASLNPRMTVRGIIGEALHVRRAGPGTARSAEVRRVLDLVALDSSYADRYPRELSGGQRQRVAIARALAVEPELIIADEITSSLDVSVQAQVLNLIREIQRREGLSILFIAHNVAIVRYLSDAIAVMHMGRIVEVAPASELLAAPQHPYTRTLLEAVPQLGAGVDETSPWQPLGEPTDPHHPPAGCRFHPRCPVGPVTSADRQVCLTSDPHDGAAARLHRAACHFVDAEPGPGRPQQPNAGAIVSPSGQEP